MSSDTPSDDSPDATSHPYLGTIPTWIRFALTNLQIVAIGALAFAGVATALFWAIRINAQAIGSGLIGGFAYIVFTIIGTVVFAGVILLCHARKPWYWYAGWTEAGYLAQAGVLLAAVSVYGWFLQPTEVYPSGISWLVLDLPLESQPTDPVVGAVFIGIPLAVALLNKPTSSEPPTPWPSGWKYNTPGDLWVADESMDVDDPDENPFVFGEGRRHGTTSENEITGAPGANESSSESSGPAAEAAGVGSDAADIEASASVDARDLKDTDNEDDSTVRERMRMTASGDEPAEEQGDVWADLHFPGWTRPYKNEMSFDDIGGLEHQKEELSRRVLQPARGDQEVYEQLGVTLPNVLLYGEPGTGKTYLSEAFIGELNAPHLLTSGGEITSQYINASSSRVAEMFRDAKKLVEKYGIAVIFIDELDAVLPDRRGEGHQEDKKVVNEFLKFLDSCNEHNIIVIGATNYRERLDDAAVRPGRMDVQLEVPMPGRMARTEIIRAQLESRAHTERAHKEASTIAKYATDASAADLATMVKEAALTAANEGREEITDDHLWDAYNTLEDDLEGDDPKEA